MLLIKRLQHSLTKNNSIKCFPRGSIRLAISCIASISFCFFSSLDMPQYGVMSPTKLSAKSWTSAVRKRKFYSIENSNFHSTNELNMCKYLPISKHFVLSRPSLPSSKNVIMLILYMCPATVSGSGTLRSTHPARFMCYETPTKYWYET